MDQSVVIEARQSGRCSSIGADAFKAKLKRTPLTVGVMLLEEASAVIGTSPELIFVPDIACTRAVFTSTRRLVS